MSSEQICANVAGTWAHDTMTRRIRQDILPRVLADNAEYLTQHPESQYRMDELIASLPPNDDFCQSQSPLRPLCDCGEDVSTWRSLIEVIPSNCRNWLDAPWIITEFYLHRRVVEAFEYFEGGYDPYKIQKLNGLYSCTEAVEQLSAIFTTYESTTSSEVIDQSQSSALDLIELGVLTSLWGNKKDLSLFPAAPPSSDNNNHNIHEDSKLNVSIKVSIQQTLEELRRNSFDNILDNQLLKLMDNFKRHKMGLTSDKRKIGIVVDNAGFEVISDFFLGHALLHGGVADEVVFYTKQHPTFVSDATNCDCLETIDYLASQGGIHTKHIALEWKENVKNGKFSFQSDFFWCQPTGFEFRPTHIADQLINNYITFIKGDANYRRLLDDRLWREDTSSDEVLHYWGDTRVCALRALKSEVVCGVSTQNQRYASEKDSSWRVNGDWAVIQCNC